jgi:hypothetical protein
MLGRNISNRVEKLEALHRRDDEMLMLWRTPGTDVDETVAAARKMGLFQPGDLVLSAEWLGSGDLPKPTWHRDFPQKLRPAEMASCLAAAETLANLKQKAGVAVSPGEALSQVHLTEMRDEELWYGLFGVRT